MKIYRAFLFFFFETIIVFFCVAAGPFYVDDSGNDVNSGTNITEPFASIQHAVDIVSSGLPTITSSTIYIFPGTYLEDVDITSNKNSSYLSIMALSNIRPIIDGGGTRSWAFRIMGASNIIIRDFIIKKFKYSGIYFDGNSKNNKIINNLVFSNDVVGGYGGIRLKLDTVDNVLILSNEIWGNGDSGVGCYGIYIDAGDNHQIYRNLIHDNLDRGIRVRNDATNVRIINNTIFGNGNDGIEMQNTSSGVLYNNIIESNAGYAVDASSTGLIFGNYNLIYNNTGGGFSSLDLGGNNITNKNPLLDKANQFRISEMTSPAIDSGTNIPNVTDIFFGSAPDIGWKEYKVSMFNLVKSISNIHSPFNGKSVPGAEVIYKISFTNYLSGTNEVIYDQLPSSVMFWSNYWGTATGWTLEYSTNTSPTNLYNSSSYTHNIVIKSNIKWVRWKKNIVNGGEAGTFVYSVIIR